MRSVSGIKRHAWFLQFYCGESSECAKVCQEYEISYVGVERKDIVHLWGILPPTALSKQFEACIYLARRVQLCRGSVSFALPRCAEGFKQPNVENAVGQLQLTPLDVDDLSRQLRIHINNHRLIVELQGLRVLGGSVHDEGAVARADGCSRRVAISIINALFRCAARKTGSFFCRFCLDHSSFPLVSSIRQAVAPFVVARL